MNVTNGNGTSGNVPFDEGMCERYLLGELSEPEQELFETAYFNDDSFFNRFLAVKDELLDLYSRNELDPDKRARVEGRFLSTAPRRQRLAESKEFINSVTHIADRSAPSVSADSRPVSFIESIRRFFSAPALATAGVLLVLLAAGMWILYRRDASELKAGPADQPTSSNTAPLNEEVSSGSVPEDGNTKTNQQPGSSETAPERKNPEQPEIATNPGGNVPPVNSAPVPGQSVNPQNVATIPTPTPAPQVAEVKPPEPKPEVAGQRTESVTLSSTSRSITSRNTASIGTATQSVVVRMLFGGDAYPSYSVRVSTLGGGTVWRTSNLTTVMNAGAKSLTITLPAGSLSRKDYIVTLEGRSKDGKLETIREYYLHIDRH